MKTKRKTSFYINVYRFLKKKKGLFSRRRLLTTIVRIYIFFFSPGRIVIIRIIIRMISYSVRKPCFDIGDYLFSFDNRVLLYYRQFQTNTTRNRRPHTGIFLYFQVGFLEVPFNDSPPPGRYRRCLKEKKINKING